MVNFLESIKCRYKRIVKLVRDKLLLKKYKVHNSKFKDTVPKNRVRRIGYKLCCLMIGVVVTFDVVCAYGFTVYANSANQIGTNRALGSPVLNYNFETDDWNKWELVVWGIYLSNFVVPFYDDYGSAFSSGSSNGTQGRGMEVLDWGSGTDYANKATLTELVNTAIKCAGSSQQDIWVTYSEVNGAGSHIRNSDIVVVDPNTDPNLARKAKLNDLFFTSDGSSVYAGETTADVGFISDFLSGDGYQFNNIARTNKDVCSANYAEIAAPVSASLPTFWIKVDSGKFVKILDYTDAYDVQLLPAILGSVGSGQYAESIKPKMTDMLKNSNDLNIILDCFGNIVTTYNGRRVMTIPACMNQHLTETNKVNLLNSIVFNGYGNLPNREGIILSSRQEDNGKTGLFTSSTKGTGMIQSGGLPAFASTGSRGLPDGAVAVYYDSDQFITRITENGSGPDVSEAYKSLLKASTDNSTSGTLKIESTNSSESAMALSESKDEFESIFITMIAGSTLSNILDTKPAEINTKLEMVDGSEKSLFMSSPAYVPVQMKIGLDKSKMTADGMYRKYIDYLFSAYNVQENDVNRNDVLAVLTETDNKEIANDLTVDTEEGRRALASFILQSNKVTTNGAVDVDVLAEELKSLTQSTVFSKLTSVESISKIEYDASLKYESAWDSKNNSKNNTGSQEALFTGRVVKVYVPNQVISDINAIMGVVEGTDFALYAPHIYMSYLKWYGVLDNKLYDTTTSTRGSYLNPDIFKESNNVALSEDISKIADFTSVEDKEAAIVDYAYLMLHPESGKAYRSQMTISGLTEMAYDTYYKICYGKGQTSTSDNGTNLNGGFLNVYDYSDNPFTSSFIDNFVTIFARSIAAIIVLIVIMGVLRQRKLSWYFLTIAATLCTFVMAPSSGELTPFICNKIIGRMFDNNVMYWGLQEAIANAEIGSKNSGYTVLNGLSEEDQMDVSKTVKTLNMVYSDRALSIKKDISSKVIQNIDSELGEIQKMKSTRWLLPIIMRQFSSNDGKADYVYQPLADVYDDLRNYYWMYNPEDGEASGLIIGRSSSSAKQYSDREKEQMIDEVRSGGIYKGYKSTVDNYDSATVPYKSSAYGEPGNLKELSGLTHIYSLYLHDDATLNPIMIDRHDFTDRSVDNNFTTGEFEKWYVEQMENASMGKTAYQMEVLNIYTVSSEYDRYDRSTVSDCLGYLWSTENAYHYMYQIVKDSVAVGNTSVKAGKVISQLQGGYKTVKDEDGNEKEVRVTFMHAGDTGKVRDILDLEELFTNFMPYLYEMQVQAIGTGDNDGLTEDIMIDNGIYEGNELGWFMRSNWVTKMYSNPVYTRDDKVRDSEGNTYTVKNPLFPESYPYDEGRPMVFSEAQMEELGLTEADLSTVELKCVDLNKKVCHDWTMLLNYASEGNITKEVLMCHMASVATFDFNSVMGESTGIRKDMAMYPVTMDVRNLSFDSIMKMLMINTTSDYSYVYGDTMYDLIQNSDIITVAVLWIATMLSVIVVPLFRTLFMAILFYYVLFNAIRLIVLPNRVKFEVTCGSVITNIIFSAMTIAYFALFKIMMIVAVPDEVLYDSAMRLSINNPVFVLLIIIVINIMYITGVIFLFKFCAKYRRDMGFSRYMIAGQEMLGRVSNSFERVGGRISNYIDKGTRRVADGYSAYIKKDTQAYKDSQDSRYTQKIEERQRKKESESTQKTTKTKTTNSVKEDGASTSTCTTSTNSKKTDSDFIDSQISKGRSIESSSEKKSTDEEKSNSSSSNSKSSNSLKNEDNVPKMSAPKN